MDICLKPMTRTLWRSFWQEFNYDPMAFPNGAALQKYIYEEGSADAIYDKHTQQGKLHFAILCSDALVGDVYFKHIDPMKKCCDLSIHLINDSVKNKGYGTKAEILALDHAFQDLGMDTVFASALIKNTRSCHVLTKVGFTLTHNDGLYNYYRCNRKGWRNPMLKERKDIVLIRFSSRDLGNCAGVAGEIENYYAEESIKNFSVDGSMIQPCSDCNYECLNPNQLCPNLSVDQTSIMDAICNADLVYFIVPNYCGYPCANYFAFNERTVGYFNLDRELMQKYMNVPKRFIVISNTEGENFSNAMKQQVCGEPEILYLKSSKYHKKSISGDIMDSDAAKSDLQAFLERYLF